MDNGLVCICNQTGGCYLCNPYFGYMDLGWVEVEQKQKES